MVTPIYPASNNQQAIDLNISNANQFFTILQGGIDDFIPTYEGNGEIPSVAKALNEAAAYKVPLAWTTTGEETDLLQPRIFNEDIYVPLTVPAPFSTAPSNEFWRLYSEKTAQVLIDTLTFTGDGVTTDFSIPSMVVDDPSAYLVSVDGVYQRPTIDYTVNVSTDTLSFTEAPPTTVADNISVTILGALRGALAEEIYETTADGLANTSDGQFFNVVNTTDPEAFIDLYKNNAGAALLIDTYPNSVAYNNLANAVAYEADLASSAAGEGSDLIAHTGTSDTVTEALDKLNTAVDKRTIFVGSVAELEGLSLDAGVNVYLTETGKAGDFIARSGVAPAGDPRKGRFINIANGNHVERVIEDVVLASWWGPDYAAADNSELFDYIFSVGQNKTVVFDPDKTINILPSVSKVRILSGTRVVMNGSVFHVNEEMTGSYGVAVDYAIQVSGDNIKGDRLAVTSIGTTPSFTIHSDGNHIEFEELYSENDVEETSGGGIFLGNNTALAVKKRGLKIARVITINHTGGVSLKRYKHYEIGFVSIDRYRRGLFIESCSNGKMSGGWIRNRATFVTTPEAGADGILVQTVDGDKVTRALEFSNFTVEDSGEHGVYLSGGDVASPEDIFFDNMISINCGSDGFKARAAEDNGGTSVPNYILNVNFKNCTAIDVGVLGGTRLGFNIHGCRHSRLTTPKVYALNETASCLDGIAIRGSQDIDVINPDVSEAERASISSTQSGADYLGEIAYINISGGKSRSPDYAVYLEPSAARPIRNFTIDGLACYTSAVNDFFSVNGNYINNSCAASFSTSQCIGANFSGDFSNWVFTARGFASAAGVGAVPNGSTFADLRAGTLQVRKGGSWVSL